jgi:membrane associated rhomboid family serine protease
VPVTQAIVIATVACWLVDLIPGVELGRLLGFTPFLAAVEPWRALTVMLVHADVMHLLFNMIGVLLFGGFVERALGHARYLLVYVLSGLGGSAAVLLLSAPFDPSWNTLHVGASGALFGLLGVVLTPTRALDRNWGGAAGFLVINVIYSFVAPGISWESHAGGLVVGFALGCAALLPGLRSRRHSARAVGSPEAEAHRDPDGSPRPAHPPQSSPGAPLVSRLWFWIAAVILVATMVLAVMPGLRASALMAG